MIKNLLFASLMLISLATTAQDTSKQTPSPAATESSIPTGLTYDLQLVSRYYWRGLDIDNAPAFQPDFGYTWKNGFRAGLWGTFGFKQMKETVDGVTEKFGNYAEFDPYISYTKNWFSVELNDYFTVSTIGESNYTNFKKGETGHSGVINIAMGGTKKFPLIFTASTVVYGADMGKDANGEWGLGDKNNYSSYLELIYPIMVKSIDLEIAPEFAMTPWGSGYYLTEKAAIVSAGVRLSKSLKFSDKYSMPVEISLLNNPNLKRTFFVAKFSFLTK